MMLNLKKKQYLCRCDLLNYYRLVVNLTDKILSRLHLKRHQAEGDTQPLLGSYGQDCGLGGYFCRALPSFCFFRIESQGIRSKQVDGRSRLRLTNF